MERLSPEQQQIVYQAFAPDKDMRIFGRGIRRRLAPMLGGDRNRLKLAFSLLFSLPGDPVIVYGDEIGMGENLFASRSRCGAFADAVGEQRKWRLLQRRAG